jgi:dTDP-4-dehydrorhamnose reductase
MKILVLGGGFIGQAVHKHLQDYHNSRLVTQEEVDYTLTGRHKSSKSLVEFLKSATPPYDIVVNCSGYTGTPNVDGCETNREDCWLYNVVAPQRTTRLINEYGNAPVIHISSGCIYQGDEDFTEEDVPNFGVYSEDSSFYSRSKHAGEMLLKDLDCYILRIRMPVCGYPHDKNLLVKLMKYERVIDKMNSITRVEDLAVVVEKICENRHEIPPGIFNVVNTGNVTIHEVLDALRKHGLGRASWVKVEEEELNLKCKRSNCTLNTDKLKKYRLMLPHAKYALDQCVMGLKYKWEMEYGIGGVGAF